MKLLIISNVSGYSWAASETVWHNAAMLALREGHKVTAYIHTDLMNSSQIQEFYLAGGIVKKWQANRIARLQSIKEKTFPTFSKGFLDSFDVILVSLGSLPAMNYVPGLVKGLLRTNSPFVLFCQFNADHLIMSSRERSTVMDIMLIASATVFISKQNVIQARRQFAVEPPNLKLVLNSAKNEGDSITPWPEESDEFCFGCVARLEVAWKGQDLLLDVLSQPQWRERSWRLRFYGEGPDREYLERLVRFYKLSDRVTFEGQVSDLVSIWARNHLLVLPSHGDGTPLVILEALMAGRPVVSTHVGEVSEIITQEAGFLAEAATLISFSRAMERAWESRAQWKKMGEKGRQILINGPARNSAKELLDVCSSVVSRE
jgi:glycosyltransferase involved in cell wall biosynthesis